MKYILRFNKFFFSVQIDNVLFKIIDAPWTIYDFEELISDNAKEPRWSIASDIAIFFNNRFNRPNVSERRDKAWLKEALASKRVTQFNRRSIFFYPWYTVYIR